MKTPPDNPEFARFTGAMRQIMRVSKIELQRRMDAEKVAKRPSKVSSSRVSAVSSKPAN
jgi:hypothetical protein